MQHRDRTLTVPSSEPLTKVPGWEREKSMLQMRLSCASHSVSGVPPCSAGTHHQLPGACWLAERFEVTAAGYEQCSVRPQALEQWQGTDSQLSRHSLLCWCTEDKLKAACRPGVLTSASQSVTMPS